MSLTKKIDFAVVFEVRNANPNGDPLNGNRPRTTFDGYGEMSDVSIKRKIRDRLLEMGVPIFVQSDDRKTDDCVSLRVRAERVLAGKKSAAEKVALACSTWFDVRAFGQLFAFKASTDKKKGKESEEGGDDKSVSIGIRGPVTVQSAFSRQLVSVTSNQITKSVSGEGDGKKRGSDTMGMKHRVDQGVYVFFGSMNPQLAARTGFSDDDAAMIKTVLPKLFENDASSARPEGSMEVLKVVWWQHTSLHGQTSSAKIHRSLQVEVDGSISFNAAEGGPEPEIINGF